ncbi:MAG: nucleotidyltransferase domain-containing protein [Thermoplasmata archaeon]
MGPRKPRARESEEFASQITSLFAKQPAIRSVRLVGSRAEGRATPLSDWDFAVETREFGPAAIALPQIIHSLSPLGTLWDPLSRHQCFIAILPGPRKVDFVFQEPHRPEPPYVASANTLPAIDVHFWDWIIWLAAKEAGQRHRLVTDELRKMHGYLLRPLGALEVPTTIGEAVQAFLSARELAERRFRTNLSHLLSTECIRFLTDAGFAL